jgi:alpha-2-macroglobulin
MRGGECNTSDVGDEHGSARGSARGRRASIGLVRRCAPLTLSCPGVPGLWSVLLLATACTSTKPAPVDESPTVAPPALDLWAGVPPIAGDEDDVTAELKPVAGPARPRSPAPPSEQTRDPTPDLPLQVLRTSPTQKAPGLVGAITATFNQAMVPLATVDDLELERSPLAISPQPPGKYRWLGTQMIAFEASGRLPFSTTYTATVAAGETSTAGARLAKPVSWQFSTPPLEISRQTPSPWSHVALDPVLVLTFNQDIRADELAAAIGLSGGGGSVALTRVPAGEYAALAEPYRSAAQSGRAER